MTVVTINYRLGAFGFLSLDDPQLNIPGNQAFKDQRMALQWVQVNMMTHHEILSHLRYQNIRCEDFIDK